MKAIQPTGSYCLGHKNKATGWKTVAFGSRKDPDKIENNELLKVNSSLVYENAKIVGCTKIYTSNMNCEMAPSWLNFPVCVNHRINGPAIEVIKAYIDGPRRHNQEEWWMYGIHLTNVYNDTI